MNNKTIDPKETIDLNSSFTNEEFFKIYKNTFSNPYHIEGELMRLVKSYKAYSILEKKPITHYIKELRNANISTIVLWEKPSTTRIIFFI